MTEAPPPSATSPAATEATPLGPLPLLVAVTGHRDPRLEDRSALEAGVRSVLTELRARHPHTPLTLLSPLAEGADRLAARVAIEEGLRLVVPLPLSRAVYESSFEDEASRAEFASLLDQAAEAFVLPTVPSIDPASLREPGPERDRQYGALGAWLARQAHVLLALWDGAPGATGGTGDVVRHRLEGAPPELLSGVAADADVLEPADVGSVHHIFTPRATSAANDARLSSEARPGSLRVLSPEGDAPDTQDALAALERFNQDCALYGDEIEEAAAGGRAYALDTTPATLPALAAGLPAAARGSLDHFGIADALAIRFQRVTDRARRRLFSLVFLAAAAFALFHVMPAHAPGGDGHGAAEDHASEGEHAADEDHASEAEHTTDPDAVADSGHDEADDHADDAGHADEPSTEDDHADDLADDHSADEDHADDHATHDSSSPLALLLGAPWLLLLASLAFSGLASLVASGQRRADAQNRYQDARALAEALRVQLFWRLAGITDDVADHYRGMQRGELAWIRRALRAGSLRPSGATDPAGIADPVASEHLPLVRDAWVRAQRDYFSAKAESEHEAHERTEGRVRLLLTTSIGLSLLLAAILVVPLLIPIPWLVDLRHSVETPLWHGAFLFSIVLCAITAGMVHTYDQHLAHAEHAKRYARMGALFATAAAGLSALDENDAGDAEARATAARAILRRLGAEALAENGDWLVLHRERPLEKPHAG